MVNQTLIGIIASALLAGCASSTYGQEKVPQPLYGDSHRAQTMEQSNEPQTPALRHLESGKNYIVLIDIYDDVKKLSKLVGFSGDYGHIELVRDGKSYGCRPPQCSEIPLARLEQKFHGQRFEVREMQINGSPEKATKWFRENLEGKSYDFFYRNCTDAVVSMYTASGDRTRRVNPVNVDRTYATNEQLRRFMAESGIPKPNRTEVFFPDQFTQVGTLVARDTFGGR